MFSGPFKWKAEDEKRHHLLARVRNKGWDVYNTWTLDADESETLEFNY